MKQIQIAIIGAGAGGLMAAYQAANLLKEEGRRVSVIVFEGNNRPGKKLLATGNGRCNLTNMNSSPANYHGDQAAGEFLSLVSPQDIMDEFEKLGLLCRADEAGRVYPCNLQAAAVLQILRSACEEKQVQFVYEQNIQSMRRVQDGFLLKSETGEEFLAKHCILASGGRASPKHSCGMNGYALAKQMGHSVTALAPALTAILCKGKSLSALKGMRCRAKVSLLGDGKKIYEEDGEILFADKALSGICVFNVSLRVAEHARFGQIAGVKYNDLTIALDLAEQLIHKQLESYCHHLRRRYPSRRTGELLVGLINIKVGEELLKSLKLDLKLPLSALTDQQITCIVSAVKAWRFPVLGLPDWEKAQVTAGGVPLAEIHQKTMQSRCAEGLYLAGELLDVHGDCGGYNLHFAWATGMLAGRAAAQNEPPTKSIRPKREHPYRMPHANRQNQIHERDLKSYD